MPNKKNSSKVILFFEKLVKILRENRHWVILAVVVLAIKIFTPGTFLILAYAGLFYLLFYPIVARLQKVLRSNTLAVIVFILALTALIIFAAVFLIPTLVNQIVEFSKNYPQIQKSLIEQIDAGQKSFKGFQTEFLKVTSISTEGVFTKYIHQWGQAILAFFDEIAHSISGILTRLLEVCIAFIVSLYLLFERKNILKLFNISFEKKASVKEKKLLTLAYEQIIAYMSGLILLSLISFFITWIFLHFIGMRFALLFALWTGILHFIPVFGPLLAAIPIVIVAWTQSTTLAVAVTIFILLFQIVDSYLLAPIVLGHKSQLSPLVILITMLIGAELFGILGMIIAIPVASLLLLIWKVYFDKI